MNELLAWVVPAHESHKLKSNSFLNFHHCEQLLIIKTINNKDMGEVDWKKYMNIFKLLNVEMSNQIEWEILGSFLNEFI